MAALEVVALEEAQQVASSEEAQKALTYSRPLVYNHYLLNQYDQEEKELRNMEACDTTAPIIDHMYDHQAPRYLMPLFKDDGPWEIKKVLTKSDVNHLHRLLLSHDIVERYIFSYWDVKRVQWLKYNGDSVKVLVRDFDTLRDCKLVFKKWSSNNSYIFQAGWNRRFVKPMNLEAGDEVGMFWNPTSRFSVFKLLKKHASTKTVDQNQPIFNLL